MKYFCSVISKLSYLARIISVTLSCLDNKSLSIQGGSRFLKLHLLYSRTNLPVWCLKLDSCEVVLEKSSYFLWFVLQPFVDASLCPCFFFYCSHTQNKWLQRFFSTLSSSQLFRALFSFFFSCVFPLSWLVTLRYSQLSCPSVDL